MIPNGQHTKPTNGRATDEEPSATASLSGLAHDAIELAELQSKLLVLDVKAATQQAWMSMAICVVGACLLLGCIPVALLALAEWFTTQFEWSRTASLAAAAGIGMLSSAAAVAAAWLRLRDGLQSLQRSREELNRNLTWIKSNLKRESPQPFGNSLTVNATPEEHKNGRYSCHEKTTTTRPRARVEEEAPLKDEIELAHDVVDYLKEYAREKPEVVALWCLGIGFILGWKLKPW